MYGVPLKIKDTQSRIQHEVEGVLLGKNRLVDAAAVDSELSLLLQDPYDITGPTRNAYYNHYFRREAGEFGSRLICAVRLDGPNVERIKQMIGEAIAVERYGFLGRGYFDPRQRATGDYCAGDAWIMDAFGEFRNQGFDSVLDRESKLFLAYNPIEHAAIYMGWYTEQVEGALGRSDFKFMPGALAYHLHSASAKTVRSKDKFWVGPLLAKGAAFTFGAVYEPYLSYTVNLDVLAKRLRTGFTYAESVYMAMPALSWQMTVVGDPLVRPFRYSIDQQIKHLEEDKRKEVEWAYLRKVNLMVQDGRFNRALDYCRKKMLLVDSLVLREKLGDLYAINQLFDAAADQYAYVLKHAKTAETAIRVGARWMLILQMGGQHQNAAEIKESIQAAWTGHELLKWLEKAKVE
jgi:uncharacterized protein (TIGR03790 family)